MKVIAAIPAQRGDNEVDLTLTLNADGRLEVALPSASRASSAAFTVEPEALIGALVALHVPGLTPEVTPPGAAGPPGQQATRGLRAAAE